MRLATEHDDDPMDCDGCGQTFTAGELEYVEPGLGNFCPYCVSDAAIAAVDLVRSRSGEQP
jgi:hypothetical protein